MGLLAGPVAAGDLALFQSCYLPDVRATEGAEALIASSDGTLRTALVAIGGEMGRRDADVIRVSDSVAIVALRSYSYERHIIDPAGVGETRLTGEARVTITAGHLCTEAGCSFAMGDMTLEDAGELALEVIAALETAVECQQVWPTSN